MKKLFILLLIIISASCHAQFPSNATTGTPTTSVLTRGGARIDSLLQINTSCFTDTTVANRGRIDEVPGAMVRTCDNTIWLRNNTATQWIVFGGASGGDVDSVTFNESALVDTVLYWIDGTSYVAGLIDKDCGLVSGGIVTHDSLYKFNVSSSVYISCCDGTRRTTASTQVTLSAAHATLNRFDAVILRDTGVAVITGTAGANPEQPQLAACEILLTYILVTANTTTFTCATPDTTIYDETGGTEWTPSASGVTVNFTNTTNPYHLTRSADVGAFTNGQSFSFDIGSIDFEVFRYAYLRFFIRLKSTFATNTRIQVGLFANSGGTFTGQYVTISNGQYGFNRTTTGNYQTIVIPVSAWNNLATTTTISTLIFRLNGSNANGFYIDWIQFGGACVDPPVTVFPNGFGIVQTSNGNAVSTQPNDVLQVVGAGGATVSATGKTLTISSPSGTVTSFSSGNLSPLFTTSVATATTTPALSFTLSNAAGGTVFGNNTGSSAAPAYTSTPVLGIAGTTLGTIGLAGNTSGVVTIQPQAAAGTFNFNLPTTAGTSGYLLTSGGGGATAMTWTDPATIGGITADNGLTENVANNVQWGGTLLQNTTINTSTFITTFSGSNTSGSSGIIAITNSSTGNAISATNNGGSATANIQNSGSGNGATITSSSGNGVNATSTTGIAGRFRINPATTNTTASMMEVIRGTTGTAANGIAGSIDMKVETDGANDATANQLISKWTTAADATRTSQFTITGVNSGTTSDKLVIEGDGRIYGTGLHNSSGAVTGTTNQYIASGTYTPTLTNVTNIAASTAYTCQWTRVGNVVTVSGKVDIDATAAAASELGLSLPIASLLTAEENLGGTAASDIATSPPVRVRADATNDRAALVFTATSLTNDSYSFTFTYVIL